MDKEKELLFVCLGLALIIIGVMSNYTVIINNDCYMPVPVGDYNYVSIGNHKFFNYIESANYYFLSDIIKIGKSAISIGDILIWIGSILTLGFSGRYTVKYFKLNKTQKETNEKSRMCNMWR